MARSFSNRYRFQILQRDEFACVYCGDSGKGVILEIDHVVPKSRGGTDAKSNLATSCEPCNRSKTNTMPTDEMIREVLERDQYAVYQSRSSRYMPCSWCGKPVNIDDWEDLRFIDCVTCNKNVCEAFDEGVRTGQRMAARGVWR